MMRGAFVGNGFIKGVGLVRLFQDLDNPKKLIYMAAKSERTGYVSRDKVQFRKSKRADQD